MKRLFVAAMLIASSTAAEAQQECDPCNTFICAWGWCHDHNTGEDFPNEQRHLSGAQWYFPDTCGQAHGENEECNITASLLMNFAEKIDAMGYEPCVGT